MVASNISNYSRDIHIDPQVIVLCLVILLPTFVMVSAFMALIGATVTEAREGQQLSGLLSPADLDPLHVDRLDP